jgi:hypothetical protein
MLDPRQQQNRPPSDRPGRASPNGTEASVNQSNALRPMNVPTAASAARPYPDLSPRLPRPLSDHAPSERSEQQPYWPHEKRPRFQLEEESAPPLTTPTAPSTPAAIWHADVELPNAICNLSSAYAPGIDNDYTRAYITAHRIIQDTRALLRYGSSNQRWNREKPDRMKDATKRVRFLEDDSASYLPESELFRFSASPRNDSAEAQQLAAAIREISADDPAAQTRKIELARQLLLLKPRLRARLAVAVQAGDDNHMAEVAYWLARKRFDGDHTIQLAQMRGHTFCVVGKKEWPRDDWWVIDPWPRDPYPVQSKHHLSGGNADVIVSKPGKFGRTPSLEAERKAVEEEARREEIRAAMTRGLDASQPGPMANIGPQRVMHNCLYPTQDPTRQIYTVLIQHSNEALKQMRYPISAEHERARVIAAHIIEEARSGLKYGSSNQLWNDARTRQVQASEGPDPSEGGDLGADARIRFLRHPKAYLLPKEEVLRFAKADHKGREHRIDLANKIKHALQPSPNTSDTGARPSQAAKLALGRLCRDVLLSKPRLSAYASLGAQAGNCGNFASLAYTLARQLFDPAYTVIYASTLIPEHAFCIVGRNEWERDDWWVIDPWPRDAYPVLARHYLARRNIRYLWRKPAKGTLHSAEKTKRYEQLRSDVARKFEAQMKAYRQRQPPQQQVGAAPQGDPSGSLYNCLYPTLEPIHWIYELAPRPADD